MRIDTKQTEVYPFTELSDEAKEKARAWYRSDNLSYDWWDSVYDDADQIAECLGIEIDRKGKNRPAIYFSGFCSQGDGACFEGSYRYKKGWSQALDSYAPAAWRGADGEWIYSERNAELIKIGEALQKAQATRFYKIEATIKHRGHYNHSLCTAIDVFHTEQVSREVPEDDVRDALRAFMDWIYSELEREYDFLQSNEVIDETLSDASCYEFTEDGEVYS